MFPGTKTILNFVLNYKRLQTVKGILKEKKKNGDTVQNRHSSQAVLRKLVTVPQSPAILSSTEGLKFMALVSGC